LQKTIKPTANVKFTAGFYLFRFVCKINLFSLLFSGFVVIVKKEAAKAGTQKQEGFL